jgi:hypothetical protein
MGRLRVTEQEFDTFEEAQAYAQTRFGADSVKVYNADGEVAFNTTPATTDTYA